MDKCVYGLTELPEDTILYVPTLAKDEVVPECTKWSGVYPIPKIGDPVHIRVNRLGDATVLNYAVEYGWLLVHCRLHNAPEPRGNQNIPPMPRSGL